jgi:hypothetical protein
MIVYTSSQVIVSNMFQQRRQGFGQWGTDFIGILLQFYEGIRNYQQQERVKRMAKNILRIASAPS